MTPKKMAKKTAVKAKEKKLVGQMAGVPKPKNKNH
jgi:hypothetical protein